MPLIAAILASLAASLASAGALALFLARHAGLARSGTDDILPQLLAMAGGPFVVALSIYAVLAVTLVTAGAFGDLGRARSRMHRAVAEAASVDWTAVFAGTAFAPIAAQLVSDELRLAPLSLLRVLRAEFWRAYLKRLAAVGVVALLLAAAMVSASSAPPVLTASAPDGLLAAAAALLVGAAVGFAWLLLDDAIGCLGVEITQAGGWWPRAALDPGATGNEAAAPAAADGIVAALAALQPVLSRIETALNRSEAEGGLAPALAAVAASLDRVASAPAPRRDEIQETLRGMAETLATVAEAVQALERSPRSVSEDLDDLLNEISDLAPSGAANRF